MIMMTPEAKFSSQAGTNPVKVALFTFPTGQVVFSDGPIPIEALVQLGPVLADGSRLPDGSWQAGADNLQILDHGSSVAKFGLIRESLRAEPGALTVGDVEAASLTLHLSPEARAGGKSFLGATVEILWGWPGLPLRDYLRLYRGVVDNERHDAGELLLKTAALGSDITTSLKAPITLKTAADYPGASGGGTLPAVYGDMTEGAEGGQWEAVCVDSASFVYALAGNELHGAVTLYDGDGAEISSGDYTLNLANDFEGRGVIATATFSADPSSSEPITVKAKGRPVSGALAENPIGQARSFIADLAGQANSIVDLASWARVESALDGMGRRAAGVISATTDLGTLLTELLGEFLCSWWISGQGKIKVAVDAGAGSVSEATVVATAMPAMTADTQAEARLADILNRIPANYAFCPATGECGAFDDGSATKDLVSISKYGDRTQERSYRWVRSLAVLQELQSAEIGQAAALRQIYTLSDPEMALVGLERGDCVYFSCDRDVDAQGRLLRNQIGRVIECNTNLATERLEALVVDTTYFLTLAHPADGGFFADGSELAGGERDRRLFGAEL